MPRRRKATVDCAEMNQVHESVRASVAERMNDLLARTDKRKGKLNASDFALFEKERQSLIAELDRESALELAKRWDVDCETIDVGGALYKRHYRGSKTYLTVAGEVELTRWVYQHTTDTSAPNICPLEMNMGIIGRYWFPDAAKLATFVVAQITPQKTEELFDRIGRMRPSKASLDRLPKSISARWEQNRDTFEESLWQSVEVPKEAASVSVSLDGVHIPVDRSCGRDDPNQTGSTDELSSAIGSIYREASCATISFCDDDGQLINSIRMARAPEQKKETIKQMISHVVSHVRQTRPDLAVALIADGAVDNWTFLSSICQPNGTEILDFFHACEHLHTAIGLVFGDGTKETANKFEQWRHILRYDHDGAAKVIGYLCELCETHGYCKVLTREIEYFRKHKSRMRYAESADKGLMIGSGLVEACCKTLVTQRLKQSGMRWSIDGAQAILTPRSWDQSGRFDEAWAIIAASFQTQITVLADVVPIDSVRRKKRFKKGVRE